MSRKILIRGGMPIIFRKAFIIISSAYLGSGGKLVCLSCSNGSMRALPYASFAVGVPRRSCTVLTMIAKSAPNLLPSYSLKTRSKTICIYHSVFLPVSIHDDVSKGVDKSLLLLVRYVNKKIFCRSILGGRLRHLFVFHVDPSSVDQQTGR